ncbi:MAG TPA: hypothetical protein VMW75_03725 [Thermoanaerobaculia bacterium]|nr:hypothetical protein [Thermoanaerobaculia bacterium]
MIRNRLRDTIMRLAWSRVFMCLYTLAWLSVLIWVFYRWHGHLFAKVLASLILTIFAPTIEDLAEVFKNGKW